MPRLTQRICATVTESPLAGGKRSWSVSASADAGVFVIPDMIAQSGAIRDVETHLRRAVRDALAAYIASAGLFIKGARKQRREKSKA